jgi:hypothetical protein
MHCACHTGDKKDARAMNEEQIKFLTSRGWAASDEDEGMSPFRRGTALPSNSRTFRSSSTNWLPAKIRATSSRIGW